MVTEQTCIPCLELAPADTLNCQTNSVLLEASFCRECIDCTLQWSDEIGPLAGEENLNLTVTLPGTYTLTATDTLGFSTSVTLQKSAENMRNMIFSWLFLLTIFYLHCHVIVVIRVI